jgi:hypothetical protein
MSQLLFLIHVMSKHDALSLASVVHGLVDSEFVDASLSVLE